MLIKCPECGKEISDKSDKCIHCGYPISENIFKDNTISKKENKEISTYQNTNKEMPKPPHFEWKLVIFFSSLGIVTWFMLKTPLFAIPLIILSFFSAGLLYSVENDKYKLAQRDYNLYLSVEEKLKATAPPNCPMCGSTNTYRITTLNRATSVAIVGIASSKIGKQYGCKSCKHMW